MTRRIVLSVLAVVVIVIGGLTALSGAVVMTLFRSDGRVESGVERISSPTRALVTTAGDVTGVSAVPGLLGRPTVEVTVTDRTAGATFVGVGPAAAVDAYLADVARDVVTDVEISPFILKTSRQDGTRTPAPPQEQSFWVAKGTADGGTTKLSWAAQDGEYRVVMMNTSAAAGVDTNARFAVAVPGMGNIGLVILVIGLVILAIGVVLLVVALARTSQPTAPVASAGAPLTGAPTASAVASPVASPVDPPQAERLPH
jgi:hypothetical protein